MKGDISLFWNQFRKEKMSAWLKVKGRRKNVGKETVMIKLPIKHFWSYVRFHTLSLSAGVPALMALDDLFRAK